MDGWPQELQRRIGHHQHAPVLGNCATHAAQVTGKAQGLAGRSPCGRDYLNPARREPWQQRKYVVRQLAFARHGAVYIRCQTAHLRQQRARGIRERESNQRLFWTRHSRKVGHALGSVNVFNADSTPACFPRPMAATGVMSQTTRTLHHVYLIPGFFGFANLGDLKYFSHATDVLAHALEQAGLQAEVHAVKTWPTSNVKKRTTRLVEQIAERDPDGLAQIHLVGHSSGGLDARMLAAHPAGLGLPHAEAIAARVRSVLTIASPHRGTPLASMFTTVVGAQLLRVLSLAMIYTLRYGRVPMGVLARMAGVLVRLDNAGGEKDPLDQLYDELLSDFSADRQQEIRQFFREVGEDQSLLPQLIPQAMAVFDATIRDAPEVRYGCVLAKARQPGVGSALAAGLGPYSQASHAIYSALYQFTARMPADQLNLPTPAQSQAIRRFFGQMPEPRDSDGICPTLSQVHGEVVFGVQADHHDVIGHFHAPDHVPPHFDWLTSGSGFQRKQFEQMWQAIAQWIARG